MVMSASEPAAIAPLRSAEEMLGLLQVGQGLLQCLEYREIAAAGADTFVAGSAIFGSDDYAATIAAMRRELEKTRV